MEKKENPVKPKWLIINFIYAFCASIFGINLTIRSVEYAGAIGASIIFSLATLGLMIGAITWSRYVSRTGNYFLTFIIGTVSLFLSFLIINLFSSFIVLAILALFIHSSTISIYYGSVYLVRKKFDNVEKGLYKLEAAGGIGSIIGMLTATLTAAFLGTQNLMLGVAFIAFISILAPMIIFPDFILVLLHMPKVKEKAKHWSIMPLIENMISFITLKQEKAMTVKIRGRALISRNMIGAIGPWIPRVGFPKYYQFTQIATIIMFMSFGINDVQLYNLFSIKGISDSNIFTFSLVGTVMSTIFLKVASNNINPKRILLGYSILKVLVLYPLTIFTIMFETSILTSTIIYGFLFMSMGASWAFFIISLSSIFLKIGEKALGINNFLRESGYIVGSLFSGIFFYFISDRFTTSFAMVNSFIIATLLMIIAAFFVFKDNLEIKYTPE